MAECHVVAYPQTNREVTMHKSGTHPGFPNSVHHAVIQASNDLSVIIWWRERLPANEEQKHNKAIAESIKQEFDSRR